MKQKLALVLTIMVLGTAAFAQNDRGDAKKPALFGVHFNALDVTTPVTFRNESVTARNFSKLKDMDFGFGLSYWKGLTRTIDFSIKSNVMFHDYEIEDRNGLNQNRKEIGVELEPTLNIRPIGNNALIAPFLTVGVGAGIYSGEVGAYAPAGLGIQLNLKNTTYLLLQAQYRFTLTKDVIKDNLFYSLGFAQTIGKEKPMVVVPPPPPPVLDRDGDGVNDIDDKCPDVKGLASLQGCPDTDGDGITDADDKCPTVAGLAKYQGCPIPDTDGDGVNDEEDKCPNVKGLARYQGCPIPDTDGDGVNDEDDKCPTRSGPASNQGCPEIAKEVIEKVNLAAKNVFFATGSYKLLAKSNKSLNEVANIMKADESLMLDIDGHTDDVGTNESNQTLSDNRAGAVREYLISKGVAESRMKSTGYGEEKPVADNKTAAGRAKNRRTEMTVRNY